MDPDREGSAGRSAAVIAHASSRADLGVDRLVAVAEVVGVVTEQLPSRLYRVRLEGGSQVTAHVADRMDRNFIRVLVGDRVRLELSPVDLGRGRIVAKVS